MEHIFKSKKQVEVYIYHIGIYGPHLNIFALFGVIEDVKRLTFFVCCQSCSVIYT